MLPGSSDLSEKVVLVTGASQGIGKAIADALHEQGAHVLMVGRSTRRLEAAASSFSTAGEGRIDFIVADLTDTESIRALANTVSHYSSRLDVLVNCAGLYARGSWLESDVATLHRLLAANVEGTYELTRLLMPALIRAGGDVIFVNSTIVRSNGLNTGHFAASQHALLALADSLRAECNEQGVRVTSVFPGRTATPRQQEIFRAENREYTPDRLLQAEDVAAAVTFSLSLPATAEVTDLYIRPRHKA